MSNLDSQKNSRRKKPNSDWNSWKPGSGRKGYSPFDRPEPIVRDDQGRPMAKDRQSIDVARWIEEINNG